MRDEDRIGNSLRENLSGLDMPRWKQAEMLNTITGGAKVKRKLTAGMVFALCLMMLAAGALAATLLWQDTAEQVEPMEREQGYYDTWDGSAKAALSGALAGEELSAAYLGYWTYEAGDTSPVHLGEHLWYVTLGTQYEALINLNGEVMEAW